MNLEEENEVSVEKNFFWHLENLKDEFTKVEQRKLNKFFKYLKRNFLNQDFCDPKYYDNFSDATAKTKN